MLPRSSALTHAGRRGLEHERRVAAQAVTQFDGVDCGSLHRGGTLESVADLTGDRGFESLYPSKRLLAGRHCRLAGPG